MFVSRLPTAMFRSGPRWERSKLNGRVAAFEVSSVFCRFSIGKSIENMRCIILFSDSKYVIDGITKWIKKWKINNWKSSNKKPVKNVDLWKELDELTKKLTIDWKWVKAHSTDIYNNEVDKLARKEAEKII